MPDAVRMWGVWDSEEHRWVLVFASRGNAWKQVREWNEALGRRVYKAIPVAVAPWSTGTFTPDAEAEDEQE